MMMKKEDREYAARVIEGIISDKQSKGCANSCIECSKDSKGCARDPGGFEWKYKGILEKVIEIMRKPEPVNDLPELPRGGDAEMADSELQRLERCKKCSKSTEAEDFQGGTELYCPLHGYPCDMIIQCVYEGDTECQDTE